MANESPYTNDTSERNSGQSKPFQNVGEVAAQLVDMAVVQRELCRVCNAYASDGNMTAAVAIDDAARCVAALLESGEADD